MRISIIAALGLCLASGCTRSEGGVVLRYMAWGTPEQMDVERKLIGRFEKANPGVHVKLVVVPGTAYENKLVLMLASKTAPDVMRVDHYLFPNLVRKDYFADLSSLAGSDPGFREADFYPQAIEEGKYQGRLYALNVLFGGVIMYYNKTSFRKAGLADPYELSQRGEWTWQRVRECAKRLTSKDAEGRPKQFGLILPSFVYSLIVLRAFGGDLLSPDGTRCTLDTREAASAYQFLSDLRYKDHVCPTPSELSMSGYRFESGNVAMLLDFMGGAPIYRKTITQFDWDICPVPRGPKDDRTVLKGNQLCVSADSEHKDVAWKFLRFMTDPHIEQFYYGELRRGAPSRIAVAESKEFLSATQPPFHTRVYLDAAKRGRPLPISSRWNEIRQAAESGLEPLYTGSERDAAKLLKRVTQSVDDVLASEEGL